MKIWKCPECGYIISDIEFIQAKHNYPCPRCGRPKLSNFGSVEIFDELEKEAKKK